MQQTRSKVVPLFGKRFQLRRLPTTVGSYIFMRMMGASWRAAAANADAVQPKPRAAAEEPTIPPEKATGEMQVRALAFSVLSGAMGYEDFKFVQDACLRVVSLINEQASEVAGNDIPIPIMTDDGRWSPAAVDIADNVGLVMQLTTEVLVFCFADFFEGSGLGS